MHAKPISAKPIFPKHISPKYILAVAVLLLSAQASSWAAELSNRVQNQILERVAPAYFRGDSTSSLNLLLPLVGKLDEDALGQVDNLLADRGVPDVGTLLLDARLKLMLQGQKGMPPAHPRETSLALPVLRNEIERMLADVEQLEVLADELPEFKTLDEYREVFWDIHVATNQLRNAGQLAKYGEAFVNSTLKSNLASLSDAQLSAVDIDFDALGSEIEQAAAELREVKAELRLRSVTEAAQVIQQSSDFRDRLHAAYVIDFDGQQLVDFLRSHDRGTFSRPALREENLVSSLEALIRLQRESAGDLVAKSRLLFLGLHWWMRGRYGLGPDGFGLLKSATALTSPLAQFPLYMPAQTPTPTAPTDSGYAVPRFDRRHHYIWMYEYRVLQRHFATENKLLDRSKETTKTTLSEFY